MKTRFTLYAILLTLFFLTIPDNRFTSNAFASGPPPTPARMCRDANGTWSTCDGGGLAATTFKLLADPYGLAKPSGFLPAPRNDLPPLSYFEEFGPVCNHKGKLLYLASGNTLRTIVDDNATFTIDDSAEFNGEAADLDCLDNTACTDHFEITTGSFFENPRVSLETYSSTASIMRVKSAASPTRYYSSRYRFTSDAVKTADKRAYVTAWIDWSATGLNCANAFVAFGIMDNATDDFDILAGIGVTYTSGAANANLRAFTLVGSNRVTTELTTCPLSTYSGYNFYEIWAENGEFSILVDGVEVAGNSASCTGDCINPAGTEDDITTLTKPRGGFLIFNGSGATTSGESYIDIKSADQYREPSS